jgi:hypothetical protein
MNKRRANRHYLFEPLYLTLSGMAAFSSKNGSYVSLQNSDAGRLAGVFLALPNEELQG